VNGTWVAPPGGSLLKQRPPLLARPRLQDLALKMPEPGSLPPLAEDVLRRLVGETDITSSTPPQS
jgi:hypothetical protein